MYPEWATLEYASIRLTFDCMRARTLPMVIVAAAATPTGDAFTLFLLAVPLYALYEITILLIRLILRK